MVKRLFPPFVLSLVSALPACASSDLHIAGAPSARTYLRAEDGSQTNAELGAMHFAPNLCTEEERHVDELPLDPDSFVQMLRARGFEAKATRARNDLVYVDAKGISEKTVRFRVATLASPGAAGRELHEALLQHGEGAWGIHRSNLAILVANPSPVNDIVVFAAKTKLACWGVLTVAGLDDTFVVPGGYLEL